MKTKKIKTMVIVVFLILMALPNLLVTTIDKKHEVMREISKIYPPVLQAIFIAKQENPEKIHIFVSDKSLSEQIVDHPEIRFDTSLFTFTGWKVKPRLNEIYDYMYEDNEKIVAFLGPQLSISPNVPAHELGHMLSSIVGHVSSNAEWLSICRNAWKQKSFHPYFLPSGQTAGRGLTAEQQASEELFAECVAYLSEGRLDEFMGDYTDVAEEFIIEISENYIAKKIAKKYKIKKI